MSHQRRIAEIEARLEGHPNENYNSAKSLKDKDIEHLLKANAIMKDFVWHLSKCNQQTRNWPNEACKILAALDALGGENE